MELRHLRYFLAVIEHGTVTAAATQLHVAQPAISRQLQTLERELGVALFSRRGPRLVLTHAGTEMQRIANDLVTRSDRVEMAARQIGQGRLARISIAAADTTISEVVAPFVATMTTNDPFVTVSMVESAQIHDDVRDRCDLGISATRPPSNGLNFRSLTSVPLRGYVAPTHRWAREKRSTVAIEELVDEDLILPVPSDPTRTVLDDAVVVAAKQFRSFDEVPSPRLAQALAAAGRGVGVATDLPRFGVHPLLIHGSDGKAVTLTIHACWDSNHYAEASISRLVDRLEIFSNTLIHDAAWIV
jgi:DNA-binding transcriptional LysR family regulator